ncbi:GNAT family N-acetyltransferase [Solibacillus sp. FSL R7-0682]|uniref:GNAT family N-acetyltransferase n=1 Tax=Solibacillus sp. FSL R7-0682 TaxID=2921690 RepID=UPI0030FCE977
MNLSFNNIQIFAQVEKETEWFKHYKLDELKDRYYSNFIQFLKMPSLQQYKEMEQYLKDFHEAKGQTHVKFTFPQDKEIPDEVLDYVKNEGYTIGSLEMYAIEPKDFGHSATCEHVIVEFLSEHTLPHYLAIHFEDAKQWGEIYAAGREKMLERDFLMQRKKQIIARIDEQVVGSVDVIIESNTAEIDNFFVLPAFQKRGIGTKIQQFVMSEFADKTIILVADEEDTPREMYVKQGYTYIGKQYNVLKMDINK